MTSDQHHHCDSSDPAVRDEIRGALAMRLWLSAAALPFVLFAAAVAVIMTLSPTVIMHVLSTGYVIFWMTMGVFFVVLVWVCWRIFSYMRNLLRFRSAIARLAIREATVEFVSRHKTLTVAIRLPSGDVATLKRFSTVESPLVGERIPIIESGTGLVEGALRVAWRDRQRSAAKKLLAE